MKKRRWYFGFLGFLGLWGIPEVLTQDWFGSMWLLWFLWFLYFIPEKQMKSGLESLLGKSDKNNRDKNNGNGNSKALNQRQEQEKEENLDRIMKMLMRKYSAGGGNTVTNDEVQDFLKIGDSTAQKYLGELENRGLLEQVGKEGRGVFYKLK